MEGLIDEGERSILEYILCITVDPRYCPFLIRINNKLVITEAFSRQCPIFPSNNLINITTGFNSFQSYGLLKEKLYLIYREIYYVTTVDHKIKNQNEKLDLVN